MRTTLATVIEAMIAAGTGSSGGARGSSRKQRQQQQQQQHNVPPSLVSAACAVTIAMTRALCDFRPLSSGLSHMKVSACRLTAKPFTLVRPLSAFTQRYSSCQTAAACAAGDEQRGAYAAERERTGDDDEPSYVVVQEGATLMARLLRALPPLAAQCLTFEDAAPELLWKLHVRAAYMGFRIPYVLLLSDTPSYLRTIYPATVCLTSYCTHQLLDAHCSPLAWKSTTSVSTGMQACRRTHRRPLGAYAGLVRDQMTLAASLQFISLDPDPWYPSVMPLILSLCPPLALLAQQVSRLCMPCARAALGDSSVLLVLSLQSCCKCGMVGCSISCCRRDPLPPFG